MGPEIPASGRQERAPAAAGDSISWRRTATKRGSLQAEDLENAVRWRPLRDFTNIGVAILIAVGSVPFLGFHLGIVTVFSGLAVASAFRVWWIYRETAAKTIVKRFVL